MSAVAALPKAEPHSASEDARERAFVRRHRWGEGVLVGEYLDRTERTCALCGLVKITVHPPQGWPWREWRTREGKRWEGENTPPCLEAAP